MFPQKTNIALTADRTALTRSQALMLGRLIELNPVIQRVKRRARAAGSLDELRGRITSKFDLNVGTMVILARDRSPALAAALANAVSNQAVDIAQQLQTADGRADLVVGDFEIGLGAWIEPSHFSATPTTVDLVTGNARYGRRWLRSTCDRAPGCGPTAVVNYPFRAGVPYAASAWLRSFDESRVSMLFGTSPRDVSIGPVKGVPPTWTRVTVRWVPQTDASRAEVSFLRRGSSRGAFGVDGVLISDPRLSPAGAVGVASQAEEAKAMRLAQRVATVIPAESRGVVSSGTVPWTLGGAAMGLLVALAAIAAAWFTAKRRTDRVMERVRDDPPPASRSESKDPAVPTSSIQPDRQP